jgi:MarR family multiple antibiotic resistance transcriptional regulator
MDRRSAIKAEARLGAQAPEAGLSVGYLMSRARASLLSGLDARLEQFGLNGMQFAVLKHLAQGDAATAADLCRVMHYDGGSMTRILDRLEERALLRRERCVEDRRVVYLRVAPNGRALLPRLLAAASGVIEAHLAGFTPGETQMLRAYLKRMIENGQPAGDNRKDSNGGKS